MAVYLGVGLTVNPIQASFVLHLDAEQSTVEFSDRLQERGDLPMANLT